MNVSTQQKSWRLLWTLLQDLIVFRPANFTITLLLMIFKNLTAGIGLLFIMPLLHIIGVSIGHQETSYFTKSITKLFQAMHLPLNLISILMVYCSIISLVALIAYLEQIISAQLQQRYAHYLRIKVYESVLKSKWAFFAQQKMSTILHNTTTQIQAITGANLQLMNLLNHGILLIVYVVFAFVLSWKMTLLAMACALILLQIMRPLHRLTSRSGQTQLGRNKALFQSISEQLIALKMIKGSGFETPCLEEIQQISMEIEQQSQMLIKTTAMAKLVYSISAVLTFSALLYIAIHIFALPLTALLLILILFSRLLPIISAVQQNYQRALHLLPSYSDVKELLTNSKRYQEPSRLPNQTFTFEKTIALRHVHFNYVPNTPIFQNVSFSVRKNTTTLILGPSGVGKSTLVDLIIGLLEPTQGAIYIDQQPLEDNARSAWRRLIAYVTQENFLFHASIRDNLQRFAQTHSDEALWDALRLSAAADFVAKLNDGLDTIVGDRGVCLSGGERQRLALARALLMKPQLLILDESTNALDEENRLIVQQALQNLHGKMTMLIISHQTNLCPFADQTIFVSRPPIANTDDTQGAIVSIQHATTQKPLNIKSFST